MEPAFKHYYYMLENLVCVKSFGMISILEDCTEISVSLFRLLFKIVNNDHSVKVKTFMLDLLCYFITDIVSHQLLEVLEIVFDNFLHPIMTQRKIKNAYNLAKELVMKTKDTLEPFIHQFLDRAFDSNKCDSRWNTSRVYHLLYELSLICPDVLTAVLPRLTCKLESTEKTERMGCVALLTRMFSEKNSKLAMDHRELWQTFLERFSDISVDIRLKCVKNTFHFITNHPELVGDITEKLKVQHRDSEETVRYEIVFALVSIVRKDVDLVSKYEDLVNIVMERSLDKKFKIRKEAMTGLAMIYNGHHSKLPGVSMVTKTTARKIINKILHGYNLPDIKDKLLIESLFNLYLVPQYLEPESRMKRLYFIFATIDENASKAFISMMQMQMQIRKAYRELVSIHKHAQLEECSPDVAMKESIVTKFLPEPSKAIEFIKKLSQHLTQDEHMLSLMEKLTELEVSCQDTLEAVEGILKKLGTPSCGNLYYVTVKQLLERMCSVTVDKEAIQLLVKIVQEAVNSRRVMEQFEFDPDIGGERGMRLLIVLSFMYPYHFLTRQVVQELLIILDNCQTQVII